jgi:chromosome segregation ATPase
MSEEIKNEEIVDEGEVVEVDLPEEKPSGKIADLAPQEENDEEAEKAIEDVSEEPEEKSTDELEDYSEKVQKRISKLTRKLREAERGQESAYEYAKRIAEENQQLKTRSSSLDRSYLQEAESRLKSQKAQALAALKNAHEVADYEKVAKAQEVLAKIAVEENKVTTSKTQLEYQQNVQEEQQTNYQNYVQQPQQNVAPQLGEREQAWVEKNEWFGQDEVMTMGAMAINNQLEAEGFDVGSEEYYTEVDRRIRKEFPQKFTESSVKSKPQQKVASAGRVAGNPGSNKRQVKLSPSEVQMAKRLNVPLGEYAKYVKR